MSSQLYGPDTPRGEPLRPVPDLAGLPVDDVEGRPTGDVFGALAETGSGLVRFLDVALLENDRHVLVPIGHVRVDRANGGGRVRLRAAAREDLADIPAFEAEADALDTEYQRRLLDAHGRLFYGERYYAHPAFDHSGLYAGAHPIVREPVGAEGRERTRPRVLAPLTTLYGFRIAEDEPDIRGWPLVTGDGRAVGTITELLVDPAERKVRYVLADSRLDDTRGRALPVGFLRVEEDEHQVRAPALDADDVAALPPPPERIDRSFERRLRQTIDQRLDGSRRFHRPDFSTL